MSIARRMAVCSMFAVVAIALAAGPALAHRFNVVLLAGEPGVEPGVESVRGNDFVDGFMLATMERDSHPDQDSDGHLGGLDVYVTVIDGDGGVVEALHDARARGEIDIAAIAAPDTPMEVLTFLRERDVPLIRPGHSPFERRENLGVKRFMAAYRRAHGRSPTVAAAQGYNMARRIDAAVRAQGGVDDRAMLRDSFAQTARGFDW